MRKPLQDVAITILGLFFAVGMCVTIAYPQELRPYEPPGTRTLPYQQQAPPPAPRPAVDEVVYERFRADVQKMTLPVRKKLAEAIQEQLKRAREEGQYGKARYNERLLAILESVQ